MHYFYFVSLFFYYLLFSFTLFTLENVVAIIDCNIFERISPHFFVCIILLVYIFAIQKKNKRVKITDIYKPYLSHRAWLFWVHSHAYKRSKSKAKRTSYTNEGAKRREQLHCVNKLVGEKMYYIIECIFGCWKFCLMNERKEIVRDKKALTTDFRISKQNKRKYVQIKSILTVHKTQNTPAQRRQIC